MTPRPKAIVISWSLGAGLATYLVNWFQFQAYEIATNMWRGFGESGPSVSVWELIWLAAAHPIVEELLFRRILIEALPKRITPGLSVVLSSVIFTIAHIQYYHQPINLLAVFILGISCGSAYTASRSLVPPCIIHGTSNFLILLRKTKIRHFLASMALPPEHIEVACIGLSVLAGVAACLSIKKGLQRDTSADSAPGMA